MRANRTSLILGSVLALSIVALVGCAGSSGAASVGNPVPPLDGYGGAPSAAPSAAAGQPDQVPNGEGSNPDQVGQLVDDAKIVRTGTIDLQVKDVPTALTAARNGIRAMGGYIGASQTQSMGDSPVDEPLHLVVVPDVADDRQPADVLGHRLQPLRAARRDHHPGPAVAERDGRGPADAG